MSGKQKTVRYTAKGVVVQMPNGGQRKDYQPETSKPRSGCYRYKGFTFDWHNYCGPQKLKTDGQPAKREGRKFYKAIADWYKLTDKQREATEV
jgi:hypothetical protein